MSTEGSTRAIIAALIANIGIAVTKFIAAAISGSASMFAEAIHSVADSGNQILLIIGGKRSRREATAAHPFGYGRSRYIYAFMVSIVLFSIGGLFSVMEGFSKLQHPHELEAAWLPLSVLGVSIVLESFSLRTALREAAGWWLGLVAAVPDDGQIKSFEEITRMLQEKRQKQALLAAPATVFEATPDE